MSVRLRLTTAASLSNSTRKEGIHSKPEGGAYFCRSTVDRFFLFGPGFS